MTIQGNAKEVANFIEKWYKENLPLIELKDSRKQLSKT
jgi:hypothetical protein